MNFNCWLANTVNKNARSPSDIDFDIWLLETDQLHLIFIIQGQFLL